MDSQFFNMNIGSCKYRRVKAEAQRGYVLIMTLVLIMLAALAQAGLARRSLQLASEAVEAQANLQRYWGTVSCRKFLLDSATERFALIEEQHRKQEKPWPAPSEVSQRVKLGGLSFTIVLVDEDAKLNLNTLQSRLPGEFREIATHLTCNVVPLNLYPDTSEESQRTRRWYRSWGQVLSLADLFANQNLMALMQSTSQMTCWGGGKLNINRVSDELLEKIVAQEIDAKTARELIEARQIAAEIELDSLLIQLSLRRSQIAKLRAWLTDESHCFSLWIEIADSKRTWYHQFVTGDRGTPAELPYLAFHW